MAKGPHHDDPNEIVPVVPLKATNIRDAGAEHIMLVHEYWASEADYKAQKVSTMRFTLNRREAVRLARNLEKAAGPHPPLPHGFDPTKIRPN
jgi:hypothetical protein